MVISTRLACSRAACSMPPSMYSAMIGSIFIADAQFDHARRGRRRPRRAAAACARATCREQDRRQKRGHKQGRLVDAPQRSPQLARIIASFHAEELRPKKRRR